MKEHAIKLALAVAVVLAPIKAAMAVAGVLIVADLITGIWAAYKRGEAITSAGLRRSITKMLVYQATIILAFLVEKYMLDGVLPITKIASSFIGITELKSVLENLNNASGGQLLKNLINKLGSDNDKSSQP